jgi:hypothetical protein
VNENEVPHSWNKSEYTLILTERGSRILFRSLDQFERLRGPNLAWFGIDELTYCKKEAWLRLEARLRDVRAQRLCGFASWTPKGFDWVYDRFIGPDRKPGYVAFRAEQNKALPAEYYSRLETSYDERFYRQEALGEYLNVFGGQAYYAFDRKAQMGTITYPPDYPIWWGSISTATRCVRLWGRLATTWCACLTRWSCRIQALKACEEFLARTEKCLLMWEIPDDYDNMPNDDISYWMLQQTPEPLVVNVYGDSTGSSRDTASSRTDWQIVKEFFGRYTDRFRAHFNVPSSTGPVKDRVNCVNAMLSNHTGKRRLYVVANCRGWAADFEQLAWKVDPHGTSLSDLDKRDPVRSHLSDALGCYIVREFSMRAVQGECGGPPII